MPLLPGIFREENSPKAMDIGPLGMRIKGDDHGGGRRISVVVVVKCNSSTGAEASARTR